MNAELFQQLEPQYRDLQNHIDLLTKNQCKITDVKHRSALLGIYREKDGTYMCRVRRNAGRVFVQNLHDLADIMAAQQIDHAHFSTRQNIQLHGVPAEKVYATIQACNAADMLFRGGGGNTFRSIATSPRSGVSPTESFDTIPHTQAVWNFVSTYERAFGFGRKFKLGLSSEPADDINAGIQDLGMVARVQQGERGFKVYCGGGMGRNPSLGTVISEFAPEKEIIRYVQAAMDLFFEHGNRNVRPKARLRFVLQDIGPEAFKKLFFQYLENATAPDYKHQPIDYIAQISKLKKETAPPSDGFLQWKKRSVKPTSWGEEIRSVRLYVRDGNLNAAQLRKLAVLLDHAGIHEIRACSTQDILIPFIHTSMLPRLYADLKKELPDVINLDGDFDGRIISCIGATACSIGLLPTERARADVAKALNELVKDEPDIAPGVYESIIDGIHISGCASSCGLNLVSPIGFHGVKKRVDGEAAEFYQLHLGGQISEGFHALGCTNDQWLIPADELKSTVSTLVKGYLHHVKMQGELTLCEFMAGKREALSALPDFSTHTDLQCINRSSATDLQP
ncbi:nitrite/sulfite reductase [Pontiellaceae bacterium B12219]|nr:nitrite/sulfite reductase [Pontiellaceae bacterium B12219]